MQSESRSLPRGVTDTDNEAMGFVWPCNFLTSSESVIVRNDSLWPTNSSCHNASTWEHWKTILRKLQKFPFKRSEYSHITFKDIQFQLFAQKTLCSFPDIVTKEKCLNFNSLFYISDRVGQGTKAIRLLLFYFDEWTHLNALSRFYSQIQFPFDIVTDATLTSKYVYF